MRQAGREMLRPLRATNAESCASFALRMPGGDVPMTCELAAVLENGGSSSNKPFRSVYRCMGATGLRPHPRTEMPEEVALTCHRHTGVNT